jgi:hypothetical protein
VTTLGGLVNAAPRQSGVMLYNPTVAQRAPVRVAPSQRTTPAKRKPGEVPDVSPQFLASPEQLAQRQQAEQAKKSQDLPWWKDALGFTANVLSPLTVPGKLVTFGLEQATRHLPDEVRGFLHEPFDYVTPDSWKNTPVTDFMNAISPMYMPLLARPGEDRCGDKRSFFNKIAPFELRQRGSTRHGAGDDRTQPRL